MDFMLAAAAAFVNIALLGAFSGNSHSKHANDKIIFNSWACHCCFSFHDTEHSNTSIWSNLYVAGPSIKSIVDSASSYLFGINVAQLFGLGMLLWISRT